MSFFSRFMDDEMRMQVASVLCLIATILIFVLKERIYGSRSN